MKSTLRSIFVVSLVIVAFIVEDTASSKKRERPRMPPRCLGEPDLSTCRGYFVVYFYNNTKRRCQMSPERGCPGQGNGFLDLEECLTTCEDNRRRVRPKIKNRVTRDP
uniref:Putative kunitz/bovine pancreatic trypsin inhibitor domain protein n=2 Tax=Ixodes ricinus TaxID=34613 RepID=A0A090X971_IXORI